MLSTLDIKSLTNMSQVSLEAVSSDAFEIFFWALNIMHIQQCWEYRADHMEQPETDRQQLGLACHFD